MLTGNGAKHWQNCILRLYMLQVSTETLSCLTFHYICQVACRLYFTHKKYDFQRISYKVNTFLCHDTTIIIKIRKILSIYNV